MTPIRIRYGNGVTRSVTYKNSKNRCYSRIYLSDCVFPITRICPTRLGSSGGTIVRHLQHRFRRGLPFVCFLLALLAAVPACKLLKVEERPTPLPVGVEPNELVDVAFASEPTDPLGPLESSEINKIFLERRAEAALERRAREVKIGKDPEGKPYRQKEHNILVLSGGGVFGAYPAGVLCGWSESEKSPQEGGRPAFDVVTGISTGSLIAPLAFLGKDYDPTLKDLYTTVQ